MYNFFLLLFKINSIQDVFRNDLIFQKKIHIYIRFL